MSVTRDKTQAGLIITSVCNSAHLPYKFDFIRNGDVRKTDLGNRIYAEGDTRLEGIEECSIEELSEFGRGGIDECTGKGGGCGGEEKVDDKSSGDVELEEDRDAEGDGELEGGRDAEGDGELEGRDVEDDLGRGVGRHVPVAGPPPSLRNLTSPI